MNWCHGALVDSDRIVSLCRLQLPAGFQYHIGIMKKAIQIRGCVRVPSKWYRFQPLIDMPPFLELNKKYVLVYLKSSMSLTF